MVSAICRAAEPRECRYHGAVIRMNEVLSKKNITKEDFEIYYEARTIIENAEKTGWEEDNYREALVDIIPTPEQNDTGILSSESESAQQGYLLDKIAVKIPHYNNETITFTRHIPGDYDTFPDAPYHIRLQFNRPITENETRKLAQLLGYSYRTTIAGESLGEPYQDTPYSFIMDADTTKSRRDDLGMALSDFEEDYPQTLKNGSPLRTTNRAGEGTKGTRLVDGLGEDLEVNYYYA